MTERHAGLLLMVAATGKFREVRNDPLFAPFGAHTEEVQRWTHLLDGTVTFENPFATSTARALYAQLNALSGRYIVGFEHRALWSYTPAYIKACSWEFTNGSDEFATTVTWRGGFGLTGEDMTKRQAQVQLQTQVTCPRCRVLFDALQES